MAISALPRGRLFGVCSRRVMKRVATSSRPRVVAASGRPFATPFANALRIKNLCKINVLVHVRWNAVGLSALLHETV